MTARELHHYWHHVVVPKHEPLSDWTISVNTRFRTSAGRCTYNTKLIEIAGWHLDHSTDEQVCNTVLHEAAHAIAGPGTGHGPVWKNCARALGAEPRRCYPREVSANNRAAPNKYKIHCPRCGEIGGYKRKPKRVEAFESGRMLHRTCGNYVSLTRA